MNHDAAPFTIDTINATPSDILLANTWPTDQESGDDTRPGVDLSLSRACSSIPSVCPAGG
jgi:hypothetical protein